MEQLIIAFSTVGLAEMGDRTQLLTLILVARFKRPLTLIFAIFCASIVNFGVAGIVGSHIAEFLTPRRLQMIVGVSMVAMAIWELIPDKLSKEQKTIHKGVSAFLSMFIAYLIAEIGDKTQLATLALAAAYQSTVLVVAGATLGMLAANAPVA
jgi:putative Ca2+/H+ antiporter (TMEM165/GDT1 family)